LYIIKVFDKTDHMKFLNNTPLILASASPRRKDLLEKSGISLEIFPADIDETAVSCKDPEKYVQNLALQKAEYAAGFYTDAWVLGADTIVVADNTILNKPRSRDDAINMLQMLNDCEHSVYTGFCILKHNSTRKIINAVQTQVKFRHLSTSEILWYVNTGEPFDKAGGYGIQEKAASFVKSISGSYSNVVGLPVCEVMQAFIKLNIVQFQEIQDHAVR